MKKIWLSHTLTNNTPEYGGVKDFKIINRQSIENGDSCNTTEMVLPSHTGTHVDAPLHFIQNGRCIEDYTPEEWVFTNIQIVNFNAEPGQIIKSSDIHLDENYETEIILFRSSFEQFREKDIYWKENPGLSPELAISLIEWCPNLKIIGMDFISISSYVHREIGREAHRMFLGKDIRLIEDMHLSTLRKNVFLSQMIVAPIRFDKAEGSPCTIIGFVN